ncbi:hypothetical protein [Actinomadura hibisca]|uniref:hypothetical protein n=1 Tax=Actinomadura hibisca TaxID=68565 RepID=UPI00082E3B0D|nr:hypothetical protein [Actinomadura hibisca]
MVKPPHEAMHQTFRDDDLLITAALHCLKGATVEKVRHVDELPGDITTLLLEGRVDSVLMVELDGVPCVLAVEAQNEKDDDKETQWPLYVAYLYAKYRVPVALLVVTNRASTAAWARRPLKVEVPHLCTTMTVHTIVFGPDNVPLVTDLAQARVNVGFAAFAALVHGRSPEVTGILETLHVALDSVDIKTAKNLARITSAGLINPMAKQKWKELMSARTFEYQTDLEAEGVAKGEAKMLLHVLDGRGITLSEEGRERIGSCTDEAQLLAWMDRALNVTSEEELFA